MRRFLLAALGIALMLLAGACGRTVTAPALDCTSLAGTDSTGAASLAFTVQVCQ